MVYIYIYMDPVWAHIFPPILNSVLASLRSSGMYSAMEWTRFGEWNQGSSFAIYVAISKLLNVLPLKQT